MRRTVIVLSLLATLAGAGGGIATAVASSGAPAAGHQICLVLSNDPQHRITNDFCVEYPV